jgi:hypothetical protein
MSRSYARPGRLADGPAEREEWIDGLSKSQRVAIRGLFLAGGELPDLAQLYGVTFTAVRRAAREERANYESLHGNDEEYLARVRALEEPAAGGPVFPVRKVTPPPKPPAPTAAEVSAARRARWFAMTEEARRRRLEALAAGRERERKRKRAALDGGAGGDTRAQLEGPRTIPRPQPGPTTRC